MGSVRGDRVVYRETDREYEEAPRRTYTTIKRYQVPDAITRSIYKEDDEVTDRKIVIKRESRGVSRDSRRDDVEYRASERERETPRRDIHYRVIERDSDFDTSRSEFRVVNRERSSVRAPSPPTEERERVYRFERERDFSPARERERDYDVERYTKSTEYYQQPQAAPAPIIIRESAPAPIIIREGRRDPPIIIREERREPHYEFVERKEVEETKEETKSLVKREETPDPTPEPPPQQKPEEDYFYERRVVERRRDRSNSFDRKSEVRPRDSASQYSSDDSYEYVRHERTVEEDGRSRSPHHKRHLAEGAIAGLGAAEIIRRHRKKRGESAGHRGRDLIGGAVVGAVGAEALSRVRSMRSLRHGSRSRSHSRDRDSHRHKHRRSRSHSRSHSLSRGQQLGGLAAVAAIGALAGYAINKNRKQETVIINDRPHRSRSRRRRSRHASAYDVDNSARDPEHRNRRIAQAGLASAAAAGIWEKYRSRSRGGKSRSRSRLRTGVPIAAAGLGGAALAGLYEKNKANKEAKRDAIIEDELHRGRRRSSRSRSRSRSVAAPYPTSSRGDVDRDMIAYGNEPIYPNDPHGGNYSDEEPGVYRRRRGSSGSSPDTRRRSSRSRSRARGLTEAGLAAGAGGLAAHEYDRHHDRSRSNRDRGCEYHDVPEHVRSKSNQPSLDPEDEHQYNEPYNPPPMGNNAGYNNGGYAGPQHQQAYPNAPYFPPPPTGEAQPAQPYGEQNPYPAYHPADHVDHPPGQQSYGGYGDAGQARGGIDHQQQPGAEGRRGAEPENVSISESNNHDQREDSHEADGVNSSRPRSNSHVHFDLDSNVAYSPESSRRNGHSLDETSSSSDSRHQRHSHDKPRHDSTSPDPHHRSSSRSHSRGGGGGDDGVDDSPDLMHDQYERSPPRHRRHRRRPRHRGGDHPNKHSDSASDSDGTIELPDRFDEHGNRKSDDPLAQSISDLLAGKGGAGGLFKSIADGLLNGGSNGSGSGGGHDHDDGSDRDYGGRRRKRH